MTAIPSRFARLTWLLPISALILGMFGTWGGAPVQASQTAAKPPSPTSAQQTAGQLPGQRPSGPPRSSLGGPPESKWWHDDAVKKELVLTESQIGRIDRIYDKRARDIDPFVQEFQKQRDEVERLARERVVEVQDYQIQVNRMDTVYSRIHESRLVMLYSMYKVLTPEQYQKLLAYFDRNRGRRGGGGPHH